MRIVKIVSHGKLVARLLCPVKGDAKGTVLCFPGDGRSNWKGRTWTALADRCISIGLQVAILEYPTFQQDGATFTPLTTAIEAFECASSVLADEHGVIADSALASSFGAAVLLAIPKLPTSLKAVVFKSPAVDLATAYLHELGASRIQTWAAAQTSSPAHEAIRTATEQNLFGRAHRITAPTLIVHGTKDEVVPSSQAQLLNALMRNSKLHLMEGADHRYTQQGDWEEMLDTSITFLTQFYQPN